MKEKPKRDVPGRPIPPSASDDPPRRRLLTDDEINTIANGARSRPPAEAARHLFPLIHHITATEERACQTCRHWVPYNAAREATPRGECLYHASEGAVVRLGGEAVALLTPFDWQCKGWVRTEPEDVSNKAQKSC